MARSILEVRRTIHFFRLPWVKGEKPVRSYATVDHATSKAQRIGFQLFNNGHVRAVSHTETPPSVTLTVIPGHEGAVRRSFQRKGYKIR